MFMFVKLIKNRYVLINRWKKYIRNLKNIERENTLLKSNFSFLIREKYSVIIDPTEKIDFNSNEFNVYSQNGEDGLLLNILSFIGVKNYKIIEFGASDGRQCNSANLILNFNWKALLIEGNPEKVASGKKYYMASGINSQNVKYINSFINTENINDLFTSNGFSGEIDILSIDIDGNDYHVWKAIHCVNPRIIVCEYNAAFGPVRKCTIPYDPGFTLRSKENSGFYFGASLSLLEDLGNEKGYSLVGTDKLGVNAFFVRNDLITPELHVQNAQSCYHINLKCLEAGGFENAYNKIKHLPFYTL